MTEPFLHITRGSLTDEELAALTAVLTCALTVRAAAASPAIPITRLRRITERRPAYHSPRSWQQAA
jgi:hypothetical protein